MNIEQKYILIGFLMGLSFGVFLGYLTIMWLYVEISKGILLGTL